MTTVYRKPVDLPAVIAVFPLDGAILLPRAPLPLNIFEPRYLNMVDDALAGHRIIGMIQTAPGGSAERPALAGAGCAGRLTSFSETPDGRYLITLTGICRFRLSHETEARTPYRQAKADYAPFAADLKPDPSAETFDRAAFALALKAYLDALELRADWTAVEGAPGETLVNSLAMICPFDPREKQALLEAPTLAERRDALLGLMRIAVAARGRGGPEGVQ